jgi:hypothetical protein
VKKDGRAVMGRGLALQASQKFKDLDRWLGSQLEAWGNHVFFFPEYRLITFPVKRTWDEQARLDLITQSCEELAKGMTTVALRPFPVISPKVGCGNGRLRWEEVGPVVMQRFAPLVLKIVDQK